MRINKEILHNIARETVAARTRANRSILSAYLTGSLLDDEPLLGGTTDIDLVFIQDGQPKAEREIVSLTEAVHLDIQVHERGLYRQPRSLRLEPWMGPGLFRALPLYDPQHFLDFVQASVRGQFDLPENVLGRARSLAEKGRQGWFRLQSGNINSYKQVMHTYLAIIGLAANSIASLAGSPLPERRLLAGFYSRAEILRQPGMYSGLVGLLGALDITARKIEDWLPLWRVCLESLPEAETPLALSPARRGYYEMGIAALGTSERPAGGLWPLLTTWTEAVLNGAQEDGWQQIFEALGFSEAVLPRRIEALDAYLDRVEETLDDWGKAYGI